MCTHLQKRGSVYYFRRVIPVDLQAHFKRKQWMWSLGTKDLAEGKRLARLAGIQTDSEIEVALAAVAEGQSKPPAQHYWPLTEWDIEQAEFNVRQGIEWDDARESREEGKALLEKRLNRTSDELTDLEATFKDILNDRKYAADLQSDQLLIARSELQSLKEKAATPLLMTAAPELVRSTDKAMLDIEVIERWSKERNVSLRGIDAHRAVARWFYERTSRKPVCEIVRADVIAFKDSLVAEKQSAANIRVKLRRLNTLLRWALANDLVTQNAASGITVLNVRAAATRRKEFQIESLNALFSSPVFLEGTRPTQGRGEAAYWMPLLALFTGARMEELGQLRHMDIRERTFPDAQGESQTAWVISIREDKESGITLKNAESERDVPIHSELIILGFLQYLKSLNSPPTSNIFPLLRQNKYSKLTAKWGEWFSQYKRNVCGITDSREVFHSFRHTFKQYCRNHSIDEGLQRKIMGHAAGDTPHTYGQGHILSNMLAAMNTYKIPGLKLPPPPTYKA